MEDNVVYPFKYPESANAMLLLHSPEVKHISSSSLIHATGQAINDASVYKAEEPTKEFKQAIRARIHYQPLNRSTRWQIFQYNLRW